ncbi:MAG: hypothetical protein HWE24_06575 [Oceanospirillaceae bacterium]|nr:hypothetical protein [Oceanospirillaceae bacterium]
MILQAGIKLNVENRDVQVNFDFDTGLIGFTEKDNDGFKEYFYSESPAEFKEAFLEKFEELFAEDRHLNYKICRKNLEISSLLKELSGINKEEQ